MSVLAETRKLKACTSCTNAKTKCSPDDANSDRCKRCNRLNKACVYADAVIRTSRNRTSRKQLEARVDTIFNILTKSDLPTRINTLLPPGTNADLPEPTTKRTTPHGVDIEPLPASVAASTPSTLVNSTPRSQDSDEIVDFIETGLVSLQSAERLLATYMQEFSNYFPFVTFQPGETVTTMQLERPMLLQSVLAVATEDAFTQAKLGSELHRIIHAKMSSKPSYNLDLLQAIMVYAAFYHMFFHPETQQLLLIQYYCITLVRELGLDRSRSSSKVVSIVCHDDCVPTHSRQSETYRALLGTFCLSSSYAWSAGMPPLMSFNKHMRRCCQLLVQTNEKQADHDIRLLVELELLSSETGRTFSLSDPESCEVRGPLALQTLTEGFSSRFQQTRMEITSSGSSTLQAYLKLQSLCSQIRTYEVVFHDELWASDPSLNAGQMKTRFVQQRTKMMWKYLELSKVYLASFSNLPNSQYLRCTSTTWAQLMYVLVSTRRVIDLFAISAQSPTSATSTGMTNNEQDSTSDLGMLATEECGLDDFGRSMKSNIDQIMPGHQDGGHERRSFLVYLGIVIKKVTDGIRTRQQAPLTLPPVPMAPFQLKPNESRNRSSTTPGDLGANDHASSCATDNEPSNTGFAMSSFTAFPPWPAPGSLDFSWDTIMQDVDNSLLSGYDVAYEVVR